MPKSKKDLVNKVRLGIYSEDETMVREKVETDPEIGYVPTSRPMDYHINYGIINIDKPMGPTSHQVVDWVKGILEYKKAGHAGTLDPKVSGVLPVAGEKVTRVLDLLLHDTKEYVAALYLHEKIGLEDIKDVLKEFEGEIYQKPPQKSAVKRQLRIRRIKEIEFLDKKDRDILIRVECESGTYIRKLCQHIGYLLGTGAHMSELRRIRTGIFDEETSVGLYDLLDYYKFWREGEEEKYLRKTIFPVEKVVEPLKKIWIKDSAVSSIAHGADLGIPGISALNKDIMAEEKVAILTLKGELVGFGESVNNVKHIISDDKGLAVDVDKVIIPRDLYPKMW